MNKRLYDRVLAAGCLHDVVSRCAPAASQELIRERLKSDVGIELLGKAILYSFHYQYTPVKQLGLEAGIGALGGGTGDDNATILFCSGRRQILPHPEGRLVVHRGGRRAV